MAESKHNIDPDVRNSSSTDSPVISIPGVDRIVKESSSKLGKTVWCLFLTICFAVCLYQVGTCVFKYYSGVPAIDVHFEEIKGTPLISIVLCPPDIFGKNTVTDKLRQQYRAFFNVSNEVEIYFSDLLRLPNVTANFLWDMHEFTANKIDITMKIEISSKIITLNELKPTIVVKTIRTISGTCIYINLTDHIAIFGPIFYLKVRLPSAPVNSLITSLHVRGFFLLPEENPIYQQMQEGLSFCPKISGDIFASLTKIINLNLPFNPCNPSEVVEKCKDECIEHLFYTSLPCRLPYLNISLPECSSPQIFNESIMKSTQIIKRKSECIQKCPRKCEENIYSISGDLQNNKMDDDEDYVKFHIPNLKMKVIKEFNWYTFPSLLSDVGGIFGTFLGFCFLNCMEIVEYIYYKFKKKKRIIMFVRSVNEVSSNTRQDNTHSRQTNDYFQVRNIRGSKSSSNESEFTLSVTGLDRILNSKSNKTLRIFWLCVLCLATLLCLHQTITTVLKFINGFPDTRVEYERNNSVKFPTLTFCPKEPFTSSILIKTYKEQYIEEFNLTDASIDDIHVSKLLEMPEFNVELLWNATREDKFFKAMAKYVKLFPGVSTYDNYSDLNQHFVDTACCSCLSLDAKEFMDYEGLATNLLLFKMASTDEAAVLSQLFIHDEYDDPLVFDPLIARPIKQSIGTLTIAATKIIRLHHPKRPVANQLDVVNCELECFNNMMEKHLSCRLPFMKNSTKNWCSTPESFNHSMKMSEIVFSNFITEHKCNCPLRSQEYLYEADISECQLDLFGNIEMIIYIVLFQTNIFLVVVDYFQLNFNSVFANLCGNLGLFLGICIPSVLECLEIILYSLKRKNYERK